MGQLVPTDRNTSVLRPYGVWAVIAPWNFPYALLGAPVAAALVTGNTVVCKPSSETPLSGVAIAEIFAEAGVPAGALSCLPGSGRVVGDGLTGHPDVAGVTFTGSYDVGYRQLYQRFSTEYPKPCIVEMGGKNPAIVMASADLEQAVQGIVRSAFGMNGHKCSACSRVYVHRDVAGELLARLAKAADAIALGDPLGKGVFAGPVATRPGYDDYARFVDAFFDRIQAGVVYVNRAAGATTGAWPGVQPFGGWKGSGSTGKNIGGHYTLPCYLREQSRTVSS